jgi:GT2 family glycosyltransferase
MPTDTPLRLTVSIVLYHNPLALLSATLVSLERAVSTLGQGCRVSVRLIDNSLDAGYEATVKALLAAQRPPPMMVLDYHANARNTGFAGGHNRALALESAEYHLVLNPDVELAPDALQVGLGCLASEPGVVLVSPRVTDESGDQQFLCKGYPSVLVLLLRAFTPAAVQRLFDERLAAYELRDRCSGSAAVDVPLASGCFMLIRRSALDAAGRFCERYFLYFEDFDLSLRLAAHGRLRFLPQMRIVHHGGFAARKGWRHIWLFVRAGALFFRRNGWKWI